MKRKSISAFFMTTILLLSTEGLADDHEHGEHDGHQVEAEAFGVGPDKGVTEANAKDGIQLSSEAFKNFEIETLKLTGAGPWTLPSSAVIQSLDEVNIFRLRKGFFKRIDFFKLGSGQDKIKVSSPDLAAGDEVVVRGIAFLRIAEIAAFGGNAAGHSH